MSHKAAVATPKPPADEFPNKSRDFSEKGRKWLINDEGTVTEIFNGVKKHVLYDDSRKLATIGYGHLVSRKSIKHKAEDAAQKSYINGITEDEAQKLLTSDLKFHINGIRKNTKKPLTQEQFDTLVSLSFNAGRSALMKSRIISHINKAEYAQAAEDIKVFHVGGGNGPRRRRESSTFTNGDYK